MPAEGPGTSSLLKFARIRMNANGGDGSKETSALIEGV